MSRLDRRFEALVFDWDGTAVADRSADASRLRALIERACALGLEVAIVSGTHVGNIDGQLRARPEGPGMLHLLLNRGSEVFRADHQGVTLLHRREARPAEDAALTVAAESMVQRLAAGGLQARIVSERLNRRKIDLIGEPEWADPPKARIGELLQAVRARLREHGLGDLNEIVEMGMEAALAAGLSDASVTSDVKHVEIGLTDKSDSARWLFAELWRRGIAPGLVLVAGDEMGPLGGVPGSDFKLLVPQGDGASAVSVGVEPDGVPASVIHLGGGPARFRELLEDQIDRRVRREAPEIDRTPAWSIAVEDVEAKTERAHESLLCLADGSIGTRGSLIVPHPASAPGTVVAGAYRGAGADSELVPAPLWNRLLPASAIDGRVRRILDLHTGLLSQELETDRGSVRALLFSTLSRPGTAVLRAQGSVRGATAGSALLARAGETVGEGQEGGRHWMSIAAGRETVTVAAGQLVERGADDPAGAGVEHERGDRTEQTAQVERIAVYRCRRGEVPSREAALRDLESAEHAGFERLLAEHRTAWAARWEQADVSIEGDPELQLATRVSLFHLMASVADGGEAAVGARGLSGKGYRGHVFWDSDVFVLPFLAATHPRAARSMLEYRIRRLPAALAAARASGRAGARFAWESAADGRDVTPTRARNRAGQEVPIWTGQREEHIVADVAWGAACYLDWTGDESFEDGDGGRLLVESARYWASRIEPDSDGSGHIRGVIGPDEYHESVDDNAYTNVMARWNLRRAASLSGDAHGVEESERKRWLEAAESLVDGYDPESRLYEQFAGFFELEPLVIAELAPRRPIAADLLLGRERISEAQVVKQADVLMLHHMIPDQVAAGSLQANLNFYEPRTAHASSLSPGIYASLLARAGKLDQALAWTRLTAGIDIEDISETTAGGLHMAAMGSLWQALVLGFGGVRPDADALSIAPSLPLEWGGLELRLRFHGVRVQLLIDHDGVKLACDGSLRVRTADGATRMVQPPGEHFERPPSSKADHRPTLEDSP